MKEMGRQIKGCLSSTIEGLASVESSQVLQTMGKISLRRTQRSREN